jgi:hypothetical protein
VKILATLAFIVTSGLLSYVTNRAQKRQLELVKTSRTGAFGNALLQIAMMLLAFAQFWLLTGVFPGYLVLALVVAALVAPLLVLVVGAVAGFTLPARQAKIQTLSFLMGVQNVRRPAVGVAAMAIGLLTILCSWIGSLWVYWRHPIGDPTAIVLIALFQFTLPRLIGLPIQIAILWPIMASEFVDDDVRNAQLVGVFANIVGATIYLLFPFWIFEQDFRLILQHYHWALPPFWMLVSAPLIIFFIGTLLPFFLGVYRFRSHCRALRGWRRRWLSQLLPIVKLPEGPARATGVDGRIQELTDEMDRRAAANEYVQLYRFLEKPEDFPGLAEAKQQAFDVMKRNQTQLVEWDVSLAELTKLQSLADTVPEGRTKDIAPFLEASLKEIKDEEGSPGEHKNVMVGGLLTLTSAAATWLFRTFQSEIIAVMKQLIHMT